MEAQAHFCTEAAGLQLASTITIKGCCHSAQAYDSVEQSGGLVVRVPIVETHVRSLNIAVSQGIGLYEAMRQIDGPIQ